jgi:predicted dehydrogenase
MPADDGRLGVLLVSFASVGGQAHQKSMYLPVLGTHPALRLVAVSDERDAPAAQHALNQRDADALGLPYVADLTVALADPRVDVVSVCCPFDRREAVLAEVAAVRKPALVDKPLAADVAGCERIAASFAAAETICMPAYHYRFHPAIRAARAAVIGGTVGLPWAAHAEFLIAMGTAAWPLGELLNFGLYPVDALRAVLGVEVHSVYATVNSVFYDGPADDLSVLALNFAHGIVATTSIGRAPTTGHPNGYGGDRRLRVMGSHGNVIVDAAAPALSIAADGRAEQRYFGRESLRALIDHFVAAVRGDVSPELGPRDAQAALQIIVAARQSATTNRVVELAPRSGVST